MNEKCETCNRTPIQGWCVRCKHHLPGNEDNWQARPIITKAMEELEQFKTECTPEFFKQHQGYEEGDENAPFFTEAFLYILLGKEDARTLLALMHSLHQSLI